MSDLEAPTLDRKGEVTHAAGPNGQRPTCPLCGAGAKLIFSRNFRGRDWWLARCGCGLRFTYPLPTLEDIVGFYTTDYHRNLTEGDDQLFLPKFQHYLRIMAPYFSSGRGLDVGCATGLFPSLLRERGFDAEGLEVNPHTAAWGSRHYGVPIAVGTFETFDRPPGSFDFISMTDVVEHTLDPLATLRKINTLLSFGGGALISFPDINSPKSRYYRLMARVFGRDWLWTTCHIPQHTWEFTNSVATRCFNAAGFSILWFGRSEHNDEALKGRLTPLALPVRALAMPALAGRVGTGMTFLLRKTTELPIQASGIGL